MYLLDTPVVSELRKARSGKADPGVVNWASGVARQNMYISALSLLELESGIAGVERRDRPAAEVLRCWLDDQVVPAFEGRVLAIDAAVVKKRAALPFSDPKTDRAALLVATALAHGLTLVTRHVSTYRFGRVKVFSPWGYTPEAEEEADWQQVAKAGPLWLKNLFLRF